MSGFTFDAKAALKRARETREHPIPPIPPTREAAPGTGIGRIGRIGREHGLAEKSAEPPAPATPGGAEGKLSTIKRVEASASRGEAGGNLPPIKSAAPATSQLDKGLPRKAIGGAEVSKVGGNRDRPPATDRKSVV